MKIEVGKYYKNRNGAVVGPVYDNTDREYPFETCMSGDYRSYSEDGRYIVGRERPFDIVEECNADGSSIVEPSVEYKAAYTLTREEVALKIYGNVIHGYLYTAKPLGHIKSPGWEEGCAEQAFRLADAFIKVANQK